MAKPRPHSAVQENSVRPPPYRPQVATPVQTLPGGDQWLHEIVRGGVRVGCVLRDGQARLFDTEGHECTHRFPHVVAAASLLRAKAALLDGEIAGRPADGFTYFVFDLLHRDGRSLAREPLEERKALLKELLHGASTSVLQYCDHIVGQGAKVLAHACALGVTGVVSKQRTAPYQRGPSETWVQTPCPAAPRARELATKPRTIVEGVVITTPDRPVFPSLSVTKHDLALYYADVAERMLAYVARRPLTLVRCERGVTRDDGLRSECKFLRHEPGWHRWVRPPISRVHIQEQKKVGEYLVIDSVEGLVSLVQGDILEIHVWNSTIENIEAPDRIVLDIDPGPDVDWTQVLETAQRLRTYLESLGLASWPKLTGGKGLHVVIPFRPEHDWNAAYASARALCQHMVRQQPKHLTLDFATAGRAKKILLDYKRNHRAAVAVAAYSARAHPRGTVSLPITWDELDSDLRSDAYNIHAARVKLRAQKLDPWADFWKCRQRLTPRPR